MFIVEKRLNLAGGGKLKSFTEVANALRKNRSWEGAAPSSRAVEEAFKRALTRRLLTVRFESGREIETLRKNQHLASLLTESEPRLDGAWVLDEADGAWVLDEEGCCANEAELVDRIGSLAAQELHGAIRPDAQNVTIGVSGGRAVHRMARRLKSERVFLRSKVRIQSLSSALGFSAKKENGQVTSYEADFNALLLAESFGEETEIYYLSRPFSGEGVAVERPLTHAFVGLATMSETDRLRSQYLQSDDFKNSLGSDARAALERIKKCAEGLLKRTKGDYSPVARVCHHFFTVPAPAYVDLSPEEHEDVKNLDAQIKEVGEKFEAIKQTELWKTGRLYLLAGGPGAAPAIAAWFKHEAQWREESGEQGATITLVTEARTAEQLVALWRLRTR